MPALWLVAARQRPVVMHMWLRVEHLRHRRSVPVVYVSVDADPVPVLQQVVTAFGMVRTTLSPFDAASVDQVPTTCLSWLSYIVLVARAHSWDHGFRCCHVLNRLNSETK